MKEVKVEIRARGKRPVIRSLQQHQQQVERSSSALLAAQELFKPIVAVQPTRRLAHDTRLPHRT